MGEWLRVGTCNPIPNEQLAELKSALEEALGGPVGEQKVVPLGGPNDVVLILIDVPTVLAAAAAWYAKTLLEPTVKRQGEALRDHLPKLYSDGVKRVATALKAARARGLTTSIGVSVSSCMRGATFQIDTDDPDRVKLAIDLIRYHAADIVRLMNDPPFRAFSAEHSGVCFATNQDGDCAWTLKIDEQGRLYAPIEFRCASGSAAHWSPQLLRLYFDGPLPGPA